MLVSVAVAILQSEPRFQLRFGGLFFALTCFFAVVFTVELAARCWTAVEAPNTSGLLGRLGYLLRWASLVDVLVVVLLWVEVVAGVEGSSLVVLRLLRAVRIIGLARHSTLGKASRLLLTAVVQRRIELGIAGLLALSVLVVVSVLLFLLEREAQPEAFGSIPRAMWWAVATLTTVGYGDVYPITFWGRLAAGMAALMGVAIVALPAGIMAAAFSDAFQQVQRHHKRAQARDEDAAKG